MRLAIMSNTDKGLDAKVSNHFGRAKYINLIDGETFELERTILNHNHNFGGKLSPPKFLDDQNVDILLAKGLGENAFDSLRRFGIEVMLGADGTVRDTIEAYKNNKLRKGEIGDEDIHPMNIIE